MTMPGAQDPIDAALARITPLALNRARADAVRRRCRAQLVGRAADSRLRNVARESAMAVTVPVFLALFSALYAAVLLATTLSLAGWLP